MPSRVVHCKRESYDIYIGRGPCPQTGESGRWGNPFRLGPEDSRGATLERYRAWLWREIRAGRIPLADIAALDGKTLGCWCAPRPCHGNILSAAASWATERTSHNA